MVHGTYLRVPSIARAVTEHVHLLTTSPLSLRQASTDVDCARIEQCEWASESVQLGGVGLAVGALGMWASAFHEDGDPLGR